MDIKRIAVVRLDKIGDLILTTPAIASLRAAFPNAKITAILSSYNKAVLENSPIIDEIFEWHWSLGNIGRLRRENYDLIAVFSPTSESYFLAFLSGARNRAGYVYASRILPRVLTLIFLNQRIVSRQIPHEVVQNLDLIKRLGLPIKDELQINIDPQAKAWAENTLPTVLKIGIHYSKSWEIDLPGNFLSELIAKLKSLGEVIITHSEATPKLDAHTLSDLTFSQWAAVAAECSLFITTNTGALHVAASQDVPVIAVFEPVSADDDETRWRPWKVPFRIFRKNDPQLSEKIWTTARQWLKKN